MSNNVCVQHDEIGVTNFYSWDIIAWETAGQKLSHKLDEFDPRGQNRETVITLSIYLSLEGIWEETSYRISTLISQGNQIYI